jgi:methylglyoxal synthase
VGARIIRSLVPFSYKFMDSVAHNPDLYALHSRLCRVWCVCVVCVRVRR